MGKMTVRASTSMVWALAAASGVFWGLRLFSATAPVPAHAVAAPPFLDAKADLARLLGPGPMAASSPKVAAVVPVPGFDASKLKLLGVVLPEDGPAGGSANGSPDGSRRSAGSSASGLAFALIAVEGRPARAFRLGDEIEAGQVLQRLEARRVEIGPPGGAVAAALVLPEDGPPSRALPGAGRSSTPRPPSTAVRPVVPATSLAPAISPRRNRAAEQ
jgi:general secretion pathway protein C